MLSRFVSKRAFSVSTQVSKSIISYNGNTIEIPEEYTKQAPNRDSTWAPAQASKTEIYKNNMVRFEQKDLSKQPMPYAGIELIAQQPVRFVHGNTAVCDGANHNGPGAQGHPKIFINVDAPGSHACQYCGTRYEKEH
ncbi:hypothetical protein B0I72DRAFT_138204 [Yarrowia lipolytica]|uniref:YALI0D19030p n=3 Tax=Yarrowia lipolytica TaxID=4952 RepID=Q6C8J9_YARLI|nr:YALI0D19030p [Yarrowia lipolytica CLIB122]6GCS_M Chain M, NUMM SUBUNIT [Yarrowia lipolytica]6RFR_M Chain M, Subunit NUMM of protein NADH:Ubiquinone Oxidoreductase (Complex I) [Yarrowia lipolytica]6RFS_M Chain M, Subunit NUMM of NADH:Ubiquinone Oxidoreductase (Complex I) [Yarrowia lipolytica]6Y79_M Chain M, Subunit NUMM of protein NADH:Ubiquinone Oxidoreductase (Complex I) [Yarrowia lipolytica]6YJ4_R Chain R, Subunit NUMM of protein NADH:Ubiquinone Oxidoreductase (Complex I) [Yarrowia lipoly|eukprot:XP_503013.2 YALI0D19030p [Yarrowia lipolytica CLIB122]